MSLTCRRICLDPQGPWIQVGEEGLGPVAPFHVQMLSGRSAFQVFINCPGGRAATLAYLGQAELVPDSVGARAG